MSDNTFGTIGFTVEAAIAHITLRRPLVSNALDLTMARELQQAATECAESPEVRAVILDAEGERFSVGGDLKSFLEAGPNVGKLIEDVTDAAHDVVLRFQHMNAPLITVVRGVAAGGGMSLAIGGDIVLAAPSATFVPAYTAAGLSPDCGLSFLLPRIVGHRRAQDILLNNRRIAADEALALGLVSAIIDDAQLDAEALQRARAYAQGPTTAYGAVKRLLAASANTTLQHQLANEARSIAWLAASEDGQEGMRAFAGKRKPRFRGL